MPEKCILTTKERDSVSMRTKKKWPNGPGAATSDSGAGYGETGLGVQIDKQPDRTFRGEVGLWASACHGIRCSEQVDGWDLIGASIQKA